MPFDEATGEGTGFRFDDYTSAALVQAVDRALDCYRRPETWRRLMANAMAQDFSMDRTARGVRRALCKARRPRRLRRRAGKAFRGARAQPPRTSTRIPAVMRSRGCNGSWSGSHASRGGATWSVRSR